MSKYFFSVKKQFSFLFFFASIVAIKAQSSARWEYIQRYKEIAVEEMKRAGVPASIKLAQGLLESGAGTSSLAKQANNHFGMKCGAEWRGETFYLKDDDYDENGVLKESCFRVFKSPEESYKAHSEFLRDPNKAYRYGFLFRIPVTDYKKWAQGLKQAGYATSPTYDNALISIIEQYKLNDLGTIADPGLSDVILINDVKMTVAKAGQTTAEVAQTYKVKLKCLMKYNEGIKGANQPLAVNEHIFLQKKRRFFRGGQKTHYVKPGETMYSISQQYGVRLKSLLRKNKMSEGTEAAYGEKLHLRGWPFGRKSPKLRENVGKETPTNPFDEGTGKVPHIDETNQVDPNDLPTQGNNNGNNNSNGNNNNGSSNPNGGNNGTSNNNNGGNNGASNGTNNGGNNNNGTNNNSSGNTSSNNGNNNGGTVKPTNPTNTGGSNNSSNPTTKPTSTTGGSTTKPTSTTGGSTSSGTTTGMPSIPPTTKPTSTTGGSSTTGSTTKPTSTTGTTTTKPTSTTGGSTTKPSVPTTTEEPRPSGVQYHTVDKGETLYSIAKRYGMTVDGLKKLNDLPDNNIKLGQKLRLN